MTLNLFKKPAEYTIDSSTLIDIFNDTPWISKRDNPSLWRNVQELINNGVIISHIEVFKEIKKDGKRGEELYNWAQANKSIFADYDPVREGKIIRAMSKKYKNFVNDKVSAEHADPWLIGQAKICNLTIISQERGSSGMPAVCKDPEFSVQCIDLWELIKRQKWKIEIGGAPLAYTTP